MEHESTPAPTDTTDTTTGTAVATSIDLDAIERDLADVETALSRLDAGTYWTDEATGETLSAEYLAEHPTARHALAD